MTQQNLTLLAILENQVVNTHFIEGPLTLEALEQAAKEKLLHQVSLLSLEEQMNISTIYPLIKDIADEFCPDPIITSCWEEKAVQQLLSLAIQTPWLASNLVNRSAVTVYEGGDPMVNATSCLYENIYLHLISTLEVSYHEDIIEEKEEEETIRL